MVSRKAHSPHVATGDIQQFIRDVTADLRDLKSFYNISISSTRIQRLGEYVAWRISDLVTNFTGSFNELNQESQVDFILIRTQLTRRLTQLRSEFDQREYLEPLLVGWADNLIDLCERRQRVIPTEGQYAAKLLSSAAQALSALTISIRNGQLHSKVSKFTAYRASQAIDELQDRLEEWYHFYAGYDPLFDYWAKAEYKKFPPKIRELNDVIRQELVGIQPGDEDAIVGQPSGRDSILADLESEMIAYTPEELLDLSDVEYDWCKTQMSKASIDLGYEESWKDALEHVKSMYVEPGQQTYMVHDPAAKAVEYVRARDMVTVPRIANESCTSK